MRFHEAANYLFGLRRFPQRPGTDATEALLSFLDEPQTTIPCIQIAGSNGKGSTARMLESILTEAGFSVGLYTSPHLDDIRERVRVNERPLSKAALTAFVETVEPYITDAAAAGDSPTFFETVTALALWEFERQEVDIAVLEVGIGGRHDATSVVDPVASAVTSVSLEHTSLLGDNVETIAKDKAAVASDTSPLVTGATGDSLAAIQETVDETVVVGTADSCDISVRYHGRDGLEGSLTLAGEDWELSTNTALLGDHQAQNAAIATVLARQVSTVLDADEPTSETISRGLRNAHWPGRFEVVQQEPLVILDGAHNPGGCEQVAKTLSTFSFDDLHLVVGAMSDKDHQGIARAFSMADTVVTCEPDLERAADKAVLARVFEQETEATVTSRADVAGALNDTLDSADSGDCVLVTGSLFTVAEARSRWTRVRVPKQIDSIPAARDLLLDADVTAPGTWRMRGKGVHQVVKTRVQRRQAQYLKEELLSLGGECAVSGVEATEELVDVVLMGTMAQFKRLCQKLDGQPYGLSPVADQLRETLDIGSDGHSQEYPWEDGTAIMGILNVTPDSFHDGGEYVQENVAIEQATAMVEAGADIVDVGGESTRPGADPVTVDEEITRVVPVIEEIADLDTLISVDTRKGEVARAAVEAGADIINDVSGLADPEMRQVIGEYGVPVVVMHSIQTPVDPDRAVEYDDVVEDVIDELRERVLLAERAGLDRSQIIIDPGLGFGKSAEESFKMLSRLGEFRALGCPVLVGHSHKSMFERVGCGPDERYEATVAATALAVDRGADIVRIHDVEGNQRAVSVTEATQQANYGGTEQ